MLIKLKEQWFQFEKDRELDLADWKAKDLIQRGVAVAVATKQVKSPARNKAVRAAASK